MQFLALGNMLLELSDRLAREGRFVDASVAAGGAQALQTLWTELHPPPPPPPPAEPPAS